jgi:hypothetical protein
LHEKSTGFSRECRKKLSFLLSSPLEITKWDQSLRNGADDGFQSNHLRINHEYRASSKKCISIQEKFSLINYFIRGL